MPLKPLKLNLRDLEDRFDLADNLARSQQSADRLATVIAVVFAVALVAVITLAAWFAW